MYTVTVEYAHGQLMLKEAFNLSAEDANALDLRIKNGELHTARIVSKVKIRADKLETIVSRILIGAQI